jgi:hypothetical protein
MVRVDLPPPTRSSNPLLTQLPITTQLQRIYDPTRHGTKALTFRYWGPILRFDHQHDNGTGTGATDAERGIYYAAFSLSGCLVEVFGDTGIVEIKGQELAFVRLIRPITLLDLRGSGAMLAGSVAALAKIADRELSQAWSRYFYETYPHVEGIIYYNAHNDEEAVALYEIAEDALASVDSIAMNDLGLRPHIQQAALRNNLVFAD